MPFEKGMGAATADSGPLWIPIQNILKTLHLVDEMIALADQGDVDREDVGCGVLYGMLRDTAYKLKRMAEEEKRSHQEKGWWPLEG